MSLKQNIKNNKGIWLVIGLTLLAIDLVIPDPLPFLDEIVLGIFNVYILKV